MKKIEVLGIGCPKCVKTEQIIRESAANSGLVEGKDFTLTKIKDPTQIAARGVLMTPAVVVDDKIVSIGNIPGKHLIKSWLI